MRSCARPCTAADLLHFLAACYRTCARGTARELMDEHRLEQSDVEMRADPVEDLIFSRRINLQVDAVNHAGHSHCGAA